MKAWLVMLVALVLSGCGGGGESASEAPNEMRQVGELRAAVASQQQSVDDLKAQVASKGGPLDGLLLQILALESRLDEQQALIDELLAKTAANEGAVAGLQTELANLREAIASQQQAINQLLGNLGKTDVDPPEIQSIQAYNTFVAVPGTVYFRVAVKDAGSGVLKVELYSTDASTPVDIDTSAPFEFELPLGLKDNGERRYYVRAYDMALNGLGSIQPNISSSAASPVTVTVAIPPNGVELAGSLKGDFNYDGYVSNLGPLKPDPHASGVYYALPCCVANNKLLRLDYSTGRVTEVARGTGFSPLVDFEVDPAVRDKIFLRTYEELQVTTNAGGTWTTVAQNDLNCPAVQLSSSASNLSSAPDGQALYAYSFGYVGWVSGSSCAWPMGLSEDGGVTWEPSQFAAGYAPTFGRLSVSPADPTVVYGVSDLGLVYKSTDRGRTFTEVTSLPWSGLPGYAVSVDPFDARVVLAVTFEPNNYTAPPKIVIYRSTDAGLSWARSQVPNSEVLDAVINISTVGRPSGLTHNRHVKDLVYFVAGSGEDGIVMLRSKDGGSTWDLLTYFDPSAVSGGSLGVGVWALTSRPDADGKVDIFVPDNTNGFRRYRDPGATK